ncbi:MAG: cytidine deaminase [Bacteroidales bacterium]|nr:cytidine deaminase [Bacteroidales bacterium]
MNQKNFQFTVKEYSNFDELPELYNNLIKKAIDSSANAYAPYSKFKVGAALLLDNDEIITGNNQENAAYPSGLCAERVALFFANAQFPKNKIKAMAIVAFHSDALTPEPVSPCGSCRQVLLESQFRQEEPITLILAGRRKIIVIDDASLLLPLYFSKENLL